MKWRENIAVKALAFTAAVAAFTAAAIMGWYQLMNYDALWNDTGPYDTLGYTSYFLLGQDRLYVNSLLGLYERRDAGEELSLLEKRELDQLEDMLSPENTNLRWQLLRKNGQVIYGNTNADSADVTGGYFWFDYALGRVARPSADNAWEYYGPDTLQGALNEGDYDGVYQSASWQSDLSGWVEQARESGGAARIAPADGAVEGATDGVTLELSLNTALADDDGYANVLRVAADGGVYVYLPTIQACLEPNRFGYIFDPEDLSWAEGGSAQEAASLVLWVDEALRVDDQYFRAANQLSGWRANRQMMLGITLVCSVAGVLLMIYLCCGAGHKKDVEGVYLNWFHRIPGDVLLFLLFLGGAGAVGLGAMAVHDAYGDAPMFVQLLCVGLGVSAAAALGLGALVTVCARCKARTLLRNTWTWAICAWCWRAFLWCWGRLWELLGTMGRAAQAVPLIWKAVLGCMGYVIFTMATIQWAGGLWLLVSLLGAAYLCTWAYQWKRIRRGTQEIIGGNPSYQIDTRRMLPDLRGHADELNNLGHAISTAVDERMKSEHFKAELITNVSHDLKTPLTSIINYVDLLKKEDIGNPKAAEYIEVLDRKSQRLKKLTEDLVEASKASTGNLTVNWERLDWAQLTDQALGECGDRLEAQKLTVVRSMPEAPIWVEADGRHLWRVLDNLLSNCAKYALPGTRVYVDLRRSGDWAVLSVKNISRDPLDMPAERLMERFVRGDESRNQAGSGLGLSIAQSLTELQHGRFDIAIDGDLFKAIVTLPLAGERPQDAIQLIL